MTQTGNHIWLIDDDESIAFVLSRALKKAGYQTRTFTTVAQARNVLDGQTPDSIITDIHLPDEDGLTLLDTLKAKEMDIPVIAITAFSDLDQAVSAFQQGVFDYLAKPFDLDQVLATVARATAQVESSGTEEPSSKTRLLGDSPPMQEIFRTIGRLSRSDINVLITGETGSGKEVVARALHQHSPRATQPFVAINTAAIPTELLESELFGHEKGAFTGAHSRTAGRFEQASGGTLFLDEIGDMPLSLQTRLLRVLAEGDYYRVGGRDLLQANARVIAATHQNLEEKIAQGSFREDLYHRLNVIHLKLPPLRQRQEDIPLLANHFLAEAVAELGLDNKRFPADTLEILKSYHWPGNVRELQNLCRRVCVMAPAEAILPVDLPDELKNNTTQNIDWEREFSRWAAQSLASGTPALMANAQSRMEQILIQSALDHCGGQRAKAAELLGIGRNTLSRKLQS